MLSKANLTPVDPSPTAKPSVSNYDRVYAEAYMQSYSAVPGDDRCECMDTGDLHPTKSGETQCTRKAGITLWRVDTQDVNGTRLCEECANDAMDSGFFTDTVDDVDEDEPEPNTILRDAIKRSTFLGAYIEAMFFADGSYSEDAIFGKTIDQFSHELTRAIIRDCAIFETAHSADISDDNLTHSQKTDATNQAGHDFWFTRNGHGAGFWDGDWLEEVGERLTATSKIFGEVELYVGDDGLVYA